MSRPKACLLYVGYVVILTAIFLYIRFPSDRMTDYLTHRVRQIDPQLSLSLEGMKPSLPPGIRMTGASLLAAGEKLIEIDRIHVAPELLSLADDRTIYRFKGEALDGSFAGRADLGGSTNGNPIGIEAEFRDLGIDLIPILRSLSERRITGRLSGNVVYTGTVGTTHLSAALSDGTIELLIPVPGLEDIDFRAINTDLVLRGGRLQVNECTIDSNSLEGSLTGTVHLKKPIGESVIDLKGRVKPQPELVSQLKKNLPKALLPKRLLGKSGFPVTLDGTLAHPGFLLR